jgi:hypothetical protein
MSYWISLEDHEAEPCCDYGKPIEEFSPEYEGDEPCSKPCHPAVEIEPHAEGGTYAVGGTSEATVNVTYNYSKHFWFRDLHGKTGGETAKQLREAVQKLGTERSADYWEPTPGNAGAAVALLLSWAEQHPEAIWRVN